MQKEEDFTAVKTIADMEELVKKLSTFIEKVMPAEELTVKTRLGDEGTTRGLPYGRIYCKKWNLYLEKSNTASSLLFLKFSTDSLKNFTHLNYSTTLYNKVDFEDQFKIITTLVETIKQMK